MKIATPETSSVLAAETGTSSSSLPVQPPRRQARCYCLILLLIPLLAIPGFIRLGRSDFFLRHGASIWVQSNDAVFDMRDRNCDVLIFGDSTAMTGINPEVVQRKTGFKTCNISVTNSVLAVTGTLTLDSYLAHNPAPRVLLIQLSPDGFQPESYSWRQTVYAEGVVEMMRHSPEAESRSVLLHHPREAIAFAGYVAGFTAYAGIKDAVFHLTHLRPEEDTVTVRNGFFTPPSPPSTACEPDAVFSNPKAGGSFPRSIVEDYVRQYSSHSGLVLVNVAPIPSCDQNLAAFSRELSGVTSNSLTPLPIGLFNDARHYTAVGSTVVSRLVADELNAAAERNPALDDRSPQTTGATIAALRPVRLPG